MKTKGSEPLYGHLGELSLENPSSFYRGDTCDAARRFFSESFGLFRLMHFLGDGPYRRLFAAATVTLNEGVILTGIHYKALRSAIQNVYKLKDGTPLPLHLLIAIAEKEAVSGKLFPWRDTYQPYIEAHILNYIKEEHRQGCLDLYSGYFNMSQDDALRFETHVHIAIEYFKMYPPQYDGLNHKKGKRKPRFTQEQNEVDIKKRHSAPGCVKDTIGWAATNARCVEVLNEWEKRYNKSGEPIIKSSFHSEVQKRLGGFRIHQTCFEKFWKGVSKHLKVRGRPKEN